MIGERVEIKIGPKVEWLSNSHEPSIGTVTGHDDGNLIVTLDTPVLYGGKLIREFSVQATSLLSL